MVQPFSQSTAFKGQVVPLVCADGYRRMTICWVMWTSSLSTQPVECSSFREMSFPTHHCAMPRLSALVTVFLLFFSIRGILCWKVPGSACIMTVLGWDRLVPHINLGTDLQWLSSGPTLLKWMEMPNTKFFGFYVHKQSHVAIYKQYNFNNFQGTVYTPNSYIWLTLLCTFTNLMKADELI